MGFDFGPQGFIARKTVEGGLFLELAAQQGSGEDGFARFGWRAEDLIKVKLGPVDVTHLLTVLQSARDRRELPEGKPFVAGGVELFHKSPSGTAVINLTLDPTGGFLSVSRSKELRRSIRLTRPELVALEAYLELALRAFLVVGL